jgi:hypothetical protein
VILTQTGRKIASWPYKKNCSRFVYHKHECHKKSGQIHLYTLLFPPLPSDVKVIDIIEKEGIGTYFNFYQVQLAKNDTTIIHVN